MDLTEIWLVIKYYPTGWARFEPIYDHHKLIVEEFMFDSQCKVYEGLSDIKNNTSIFKIIANNGN